MKNLEQLNFLIDQAKSIAGSEYKLARMIGAPASSITAWKQGKQGCAVGDVVLMAHVAGLDATEWAARAIVSSYENKPEKKAALALALKKTLRATGAAVALFGAGAASAASHAMAAAAGLDLGLLYTMYKKLSYKLPLLSGHARGLA